MRLAPLAAVLVSLAGCASAASRNTGDDAAHFERLKSLAGNWTQTGQTDGPMKGAVSYRVTAGGSAVEEICFTGSPQEMVTLYTLDHGNLVLTHYCMLGNQPRMALQRVDGNTLVFDLVELGNGDPSKDMHMHHAEITLVDANSLKSAWTLWQDGKAGDTHGFDLRRASN